MVVNQKVHLGMVHARKSVTVVVDDTHIAISHDGEPITVVPRTTTREISRFKSKAHTKTSKVV